MSTHDETAVSPTEPLEMTQQQLDTLAPYLKNLPNPVQIHYWGFEDASPEEQEALYLCRALADRFETITLRTFGRRKNHRLYPVLGFMGLEGGQKTDYGVRIIGLPSGYQLTSLIAAIQAVSFRGVTLEPLTRVRLQQLTQEVSLELVTSDQDEGGTMMAKLVFGLAVAHEKIKSYLLMSNMFPEVAIQYSAHTLPHLVINGRVHLNGVAGEEIVLQHIARAAGSRHP